MIECLGCALIASIMSGFAYIFGVLIGARFGRKH